MPETAKRLTPTGETLRQLYLKSGNLCAFPGCSALMMDIDGNFVGQVCHIEAAEEEGERFNPEMSNEDRRSAANLMLMCYPHHVVTNDVDTYTVEKLRTMKADHERRFSDPQRVILEKLTDWTTIDSPKAAQTLHRMCDVLGWKQLTDENLQEMAQELNGYAERLKHVPQGVRQFLGAVAVRSYKMRDSYAVRISSPMLSSTRILASDLEGLSASRRGSSTVDAMSFMLTSWAA